MQPQVQQAGYDRLPGYSSASRLGLNRSDQERLLRHLQLKGVLVEETSRQETYQSVLSVLRVNRVSVGCHVYFLSLLLFLSCKGSRRVCWQKRISE